MNRKVTFQESVFRVSNLLSVSFQFHCLLWPLPRYNDQVVAIKHIIYSRFSFTDAVCDQDRDWTKEPKNVPVCYSFTRLLSVWKEMIVVVKMALMLRL